MLKSLKAARLWLAGRWFEPAAVVLALLMAVGVLKAKGDAAITRQRVAALETSVASKTHTARALEAEVQFLERPQNIAELAERELGMRPAAADRVIRLEDLAATRERP